MIYFNTKLRYLHLQKSDLNNKQFIKCHKEFYELIYFAGADTELSLNGVTYFPSKHSVAIIAPGTTRTINVSKDKPLKTFLISFDESLVGDNFDLKAKSDKIYSFSYNSAINLMFLTMQAVEKKNLDSNTFLDYVSLLLKLVLLEIENSASDKIIKKTPTNKILSQCIDYINTNIMDEITLETLASKFFISKSYLSHVFKACFKMGVKQYINKQKMLYAQKLIKSGTNPVKASKICSFENYSTFYRLYKSHFGVSPENDK